MRPPGTGVMVLGMHRSGTSAATRIVSLLGVATCLPEDMVRGPWNPRGHWESRSLMHLDDRLLSEMGCAWWSPPPTGEAYWQSAARITTSPAEARAAFRRVHRQVPWVWKDPRACLLVPFWRAVLGPRTAALVVFRNPLEVSDSLESRHDLSRQFGLALWERYNRLVLRHAAGMPALVTRYEELVSDPVGWSRKVGDFLGGLGIATVAALEEDLRGFVDPGLRHNSYTVEDLASQAPGTLGTYRAFEDVLGCSSSLAAPELSGEEPWVQTELGRRGPTEKPAWRPPPQVQAQG